MASLNRAMIIGNIGNAPDARNMPNGDPVAHFRVASTEAWTDRSTGERKENTEWHSVVCYRHQASFVRDFLGKGREVYIEGKLRTRKWTDKEGVERYTTEIVADAVQALGPRPEGAGNASRQPQGKGAIAPPANANPDQDEDDDLPY